MLFIGFGLNLLYAPLIKLNKTENSPSTLLIKDKKIIFIQHIY